jgi:hypothetical protein
VATWRLIVKGVELPGLWIVENRVRPVKYIYKAA